MLRKPTAKEEILVKFINNPNYHPTFEELAFIQDKKARNQVMSKWRVKSDKDMWIRTADIIDYRLKEVLAAMKEDTDRLEAVATARATDALLKQTRTDVHFAQVMHRDYPNQWFSGRMAEFKDYYRTKVLNHIRKMSASEFRAALKSPNYRDDLEAVGIAYK